MPFSSTDGLRLTKNYNEPIAPRLLCFHRVTSSTVPHFLHRGLLLYTSQVLIRDETHQQRLGLGVHFLELRHLTSLCWNIFYDCVPYLRGFQIYFEPEHPCFVACSCKLRDFVNRHLFLLVLAHNLKMSVLADGLIKTDFYIIVWSVFILWI